MKIDLPRLTERVGLDEVALVVHVKSVFDGVILEIRDEPGNVDGHGPMLPNVLVRRYGPCPHRR